MTEPIEGEVVDPGKVIFCARGKTAAARAELDRRGEYGGVIRESDVCPAGLAIVVDMDRIWADLKAKLEEAVSLGPLPGWRSTYMYPTVTSPRSAFRITGL